MDHDTNGLDRLAQGQHMLVTYRQLRDLGLSRKQIATMERRGEIGRYREGVYRLRGSKPTQDQAWMAAALAAAGGVVLSHLTAANAHGLRLYPEADLIDLLSTTNRPRLDGVAGHETLWLPPSQRTVLRSLPVTTVARTLFDTCGAVPPFVLGAATTEATRHRQTSVKDLLRVAASVPVSGRRRSLPMRELLGRLEPDFNPGGSDAELEVREVIKSSGLPPPVQQFRVKIGNKTIRIDFAYPETMTGLEYDSYKFHREDDEEFFHGGRARTWALQSLGWTIWPVTKYTSRAEIIAVAELACGLAA